MAFKPTEIIVHHSLTKDSETVSWGAIRYYHTATLGWKDIGYHAGIELVQSGTHQYYEALMGRMWDTPGAHCKGHNNKSLGICFVGNYDDDVPNDEMLEAGAKVIRLWMALYDIPFTQIFRHSAFATYKTCPGLRFPFYKLISLL